MASGVNTVRHGQYRERPRLLLWSGDQRISNVADVPRISEEDQRYKERLANVLRQLRETAAWTQEEAAEHIGVPSGKVGRWERAAFAPKGYDLGRAFRAYEPYGADWRWFFDPPEIVAINPVRDHLAGLAEAGGIAADAQERREERKRRRADAARHAARGRRSTGIQPGSPR